MVTLGTASVLALRNSKARTTALGRQRTLPLTHTTVKSCRWFSSLRQLKGDAAPWRVAEKPSQVIISSLNQLRRRNSPSVAERKPTRF